MLGIDLDAKHNTGYKTDALSYKFPHPHRIYILPCINNTWIVIELINYWCNDLKTTRYIDLSWHEIIKYLSC